jgi:hypothetical protein
MFYWNLRFIRNFHDWELEGVESVMDYLYSQISLLGGADCMSWGLNSTGGMFGVQLYNV